MAPKPQTNSFFPGPRGMPPSLVGVDIGGSKVAIGIVSDGAVGRLQRFPTPADGQAVFELIAEQVAPLVEEGAPGVGISTGGVVDPLSGRILHASDLLRGWAGFPLGERLEEALGVTVRVDNDGNAFALAEHRFGAGRDSADGIYAAVGTGLGGGIILAGQIHHGTRCMAGELGHLPAPVTARPCSCARVGHLEALTCGPALTASYHGASGRNVARLEDVVAARDAGDDLARAVLAEGGRHLGRGLGGLAMVLDVPLIVVGGGAGVGLGEQWLDVVRETISDVVPYGLGVEVRMAELGPSSPVVGAAQLLA